MEDLNKLNKAELIAKLEEMANTDVSTALRQRDEAYAKQSELATKVTDLEVKLAAGVSNEDAAELQRQLDDLTERLAATEATKGDPRPVVKVGGQQMLIIAPLVNIGGTVYTAEQLAGQPDLLAQLHKDGSHVLKPVKDL